MTWFDVWYMYVGGCLPLLWAVIMCRHNLRRRDVVAVNALILVWPIWLSVLTAYSLGKGESADAPSEFKIFK